MAILTVGTNQQYARIADAIAATRDGDVVNVQAGTYVNDFATISTKITLQGVGGMVKMVATVRPPNGKAILTTTNDVTIDRFEMSGAKVADRNGAAVRFEGGNLTISNSYIHDNENGILSGTVANGTVTIRNSEFAQNGTGDGYSHNVYIGEIRQLTIADSYFHDAVVGHEIKSRALSTTITGSRIQNNGGSASYEIDLPNGGTGLIEGNVIQQGANTQNPNMIAFGAEGARATNSLVVRGNTIVNDRSNGVAVFNATGATVTLANNQVFGFGGVATVRGPVAQTGTTILGSRPALNTSSPIGASGPTAPVVTPPPIVPPAPTPPAPAPSAPVIVGSGPDSLRLGMTGDAWQGNAQFTVRVDGVQVGGVQTVTAARGVGPSQSFDFRGTFGPAAHTVAVAFLNDAYGGTPATDRNLYIDNLSYNGVGVPGATANIRAVSNFAVPPAAGFVTPPPVSTPPVSTPPAPPPTVAVGSGPDRLTLRMAEDAWQGDAQFTVKVDGVQIGGVQTVTALRSAGASQVFEIRGTFGPAAHSVAIAFVNDAYAGTPDTDRNLYIESLGYNGANVAGASAGIRAVSTFTVPPSPGVPTPTPTTVVFSLSEDAWQGDAQAFVSIDGQRLGGLQTITASHALGQTQRLSFVVPLAAGPHQASVEFTNDAYGGTRLTDRNLFVDRIEVGAQRIDPAAAMNSGGVQIFSVPGPALPLLPTP
ncbi:MAG: right-handed parallel beta-helix repeat-containing protein [Gemmatimonadaceae bacterium]|nr:right-handed parallel beta-helix repeat-containing protein [Acetobacteraceae bacterium]